MQGLKTVALVRREDAVQMLKDLGATKVVVVGKIKDDDEYAREILKATDGNLFLIM